MMLNDDETPSLAQARERTFARTVAVLESASSLVFHLNSAGGSLAQFVFVTNSRAVDETEAAISAERFERAAAAVNSHPVLVGSPYLSCVVEQMRARVAELAIMGTQTEGKSEMLAGELERPGREMQKASLSFRAFATAAVGFHLDRPELSDVERRVQAPYFKPARVRGKAQWKQERR